MLAIFLQQAQGGEAAGVGLFLLCAGALVRQRWLRLMRRALLLLLTLFLVFAYGIPGATGGLPGSEGVQEAGLHVLRLVVLLGSLAWLLTVLEISALMGGIWFLLRPLRRLGVPLDRSVVRLVLTLEMLEDQPVRRSWREWQTEWRVSGEGSVPKGLRVRLSLPHWHWRDGFVLFLAALLMGGIAWHGSF
ncbi:MAG: hypothetical protein LBR88_10450 [Zoogloeaceae bacterium]|nr:hypothetical protein [Zoogloeaceae bacterium]